MDYAGYVKDIVLSVFMFIIRFPIMLILGIINIIDRILAYFTRDYEPSQMILFTFQMGAVGLILGYLNNATDVIPNTYQTLTELITTIYETLIDSLFWCSEHYWCVIAFVLGIAGITWYVVYEIEREQQHNLLVQMGHIDADLIEDPIEENEEPPSLTGWGIRAYSESQTSDVPSRCVKIRGMLPLESNVNILEINDALKKKLTGDRMVALWCHFAVDAAQKVVFLKFKTMEDAQLCFDRINGYYYCGRLVFVRFLREEKYTEKFPNTATF